MINGNLSVIINYILCRGKKVRRHRPDGCKELISKLGKGLSVQVFIGWTLGKDAPCRRFIARFSPGVFFAVA